MNYKICKICDKKLEFIKYEWRCYNTPKLKKEPKDKQFHYVLSEIEEYFWYPEHDLNITISSTFARVYSAYNDKSNSFHFNISLEEFEMFKFDPKNILALINKFKLYKLYK